MSENCYIVIKEEIIYLQCEECYEKNKLGTFWPASNGYGCSVQCQCGKMINEENIKIEDYEI